MQKMPWTCREVFLRNFDVADEEHLIRLVKAAYRQAERYFQKFEPGIARNGRQALVWSLIDQSLIQFARKRGFRCKESLNLPRTSYHTVISNEEILLTAKKIESPRGFPNHAEYRNHYAGCGQLTLFAEPEASEPGKLYAILVHMPDTLNPAMPGVVKVGFPNEEGNAWMERPIDLLARQNARKTIKDDASQAIDPSINEIKPAEPKPRLIEEEEDGSIS